MEVQTQLDTIMNWLDGHAIMTKAQRRSFDYMLHQLVAIGTESVETAVAIQKQNKDLLRDLKSFGEVIHKCHQAYVSVHSCIAGLAGDESVPEQWKHRVQEVYEKLNQLGAGPEWCNEADSVIAENAKLKQWLYSIVDAVGGEVCSVELIERPVNAGVCAIENGDCVEGAKVIYDCYTVESWDEDEWDGAEQVIGPDKKDVNEKGKNDE